MQHLSCPIIAIDSFQTGNIKKIKVTFTLPNRTVSHVTLRDDHVSWSWVEFVSDSEPQTIQIDTFNPTNLAHGTHLHEVRGVKIHRKQMTQEGVNP